MITGKSIGTIYKGAGPGTHWHSNDPRLSGFTLSAALVSTVNAVVTHITAFSAPSPFLSFSTSFAIAREYALSGPGGIASAANPGYVYQVDLSALSSSPTLIDPVSFISSQSNGTIAHDHNGGYELIAEVAQANPVVMNYTRPHVAGGGTGHPNVSSRLLALVRAIRDAEVLIQGGVPGGSNIHRHNVF